MEPEAEIRAAMEARVRAVREKDIEGVLRGYASGVVTFDLVTPLTNVGAGALRERLAQWFGSFATPIDYELRDVTLSVSGDVAFDHHLTHVRGTTRSGDAIDMWFRETVGYRREGGRWLVTHQHSSAPFDMTTGKTLLDLRP
jgi:ketosteroid isomerase-like protein